MEGRSASVLHRMDGQQQRQAVSAAERAIEALASGRPEAARAAARRAVELDQTGSLASLPRAVDQAADDLVGGRQISEMSMAALSAAVGPGPLEAAVARLLS